jgi:hypothetical protein
MAARREHAVIACRVRLLECATGLAGLQPGPSTFDKQPPAALARRLVLAWHKAATGTDAEDELDTLRGRLAVLEDLEFLRRRPGRE